MKKRYKEVEFFYKDHVVGFLHGRPKFKGLIRYEPYRGFGHLEMQQALEAGLTVECTIAQKPLKASKERTPRPVWVFSVFSCPEYGILNVSEQREKA